jgi:hypothetical protein
MYDETDSTVLMFLNGAPRAQRRVPTLDAFLRDCSGTQLRLPSMNRRTCHHDTRMVV